MKPELGREALLSLGIEPNPWAINLANAVLMRRSGIVYGDVTGIGALTLDRLTSLVPGNKAFVDLNTIRSPDQIASAVGFEWNHGAEMVYVDLLQYRNQNWFVGFGNLGKYLQRATIGMCLPIGLAAKHSGSTFITTAEHQYVNIRNLIRDKKVTEWFSDFVSDWFSPTTIVRWGKG